MTDRADTSRGDDRDRWRASASLPPTLPAPTPVGSGAAPADSAGDRPDAPGRDRDAPADIPAEMPGGVPAAGEQATSGGGAWPDNSAAEPAVPGAEPADTADPFADPFVDPFVDMSSTKVLSDAVQSLRTALDASLQSLEHQRALLDKLHEEKQALREAEQRRLRDPVLRDLIQLSDTCVRNSRQWQQRDDVTPETAAKVSAVLLEAADDVRLTLERQGVEGFMPQVDDTFDRTVAKAVGALETADPAKDGVVAEVRKAGYRLDDRMLRFSEVVVWRLKAAADGQAPSGDAPM